jgi:CxxC motif-containing protein (DUF1111 family)
MAYVVLAVLALAPAALRAVAWLRSPRPQTFGPAMAEEGEKLFKHEWTPHDPLANGGDGLGPVYNATSCVACHSRGGVGGSGGLDNNVTTFTVQRGPGPARQGVVHAHAVGPYQETLSQVDPDLPARSHPRVDQLVLVAGSSKGRIHMPQGVHVSQRNTPALFGANLIDAIPDREIIATERRERLRWGLAPADQDNHPVGRALRLPDGRVGHFGWKAQSSSLTSFVQAACANELGLGNPGQAQPTPLGAPGYRVPGLDLTLEQCNQLTAFVAALPRPVERLPRASDDPDWALGLDCQSQVSRQGQRLPHQPPDPERAVAGKELFQKVGCADCHTPDVGSVEGIYSDLLLHRMGTDLEGGGSYNDPVRPATPDTPTDDGSPSPSEWRTPPLWGVADSGPYLHDGRAGTLADAIQMHGGQGAAAARRFAQLAPTEQGHLLAFLKTLRAP